MAASDLPDPPSVTDSRENTSTRSSDPENAQLSPPNGVSTNVSSVAMDRALLGCGLPSLSGAPPSSSAPITMANSAVNTEAAVSDVDVMLRVKTGDESAYAYLVQKYRRPMVGFMYRMCHNPSTAEELAQEVFLRVYRSRTSYEPSAKFTTWLYRIATNLGVNYARDTRHQRPENTLNLDEADSETGQTPDLADKAPNVEEEILRCERLVAIRQKVEALPERQKMAVLMHKYQQMDYRQIAEVLKLSESATKSLLFRAYETLRAELKEFL